MSQVVLVSEAYLTALIPSFKKRICHFCLVDQQKRLETSCRKHSFNLLTGTTASSGVHAHSHVAELHPYTCVSAGLCNQAWYCSAQCQQAHWSGQLPKATADGAAAVTPHSRHLVPHSLTCATLKRFSSIKCDPGMESVIRMCLDAMALEYLEGQPPHRAGSSITESGLHQPVLGYKHNPLVVPQHQTPPHDGQQTPANHQAPHVSPMQPNHETSASASLQQLQSMRIRSESIQTCKQSSSRTWQGLDSIPPSSASGSAKLSVHPSHASHTHQASMESMQTASELGLDSPAEAQDWRATQLPSMTHAELTQLQSHAADFTDKDRRDWLINLRFLRASMQHAQWPGEIWSEDALLDMVGRIASNNFGIYSTRQRRQPQQPKEPATPSKHSDPRAVPGQAMCCHSQSSLSPQSTQRHGNKHFTCEQTQALPHGVEEKQPLPCCASPLTKGDSAIQQSAATQAEASSACSAPEPQEVLPWPLQADAHLHSPLPCSSEPTQGSPLQGSPLPDHRPRQQQPFQPQLLCDEQGSCQVQPSGNRGSKHPAQRLPTKEKPAKEDVVGREMYITASFFNHSCEPNCIKRRLVGQQSGVAVVTALRDIKASRLHCDQHRLFVQDCHWDQCWHSHPPML